MAIAWFGSRQGQTSAEAGISGVPGPKRTDPGFDPTKVTGEPYFSFVVDRLRDPIPQDGGLSARFGAIWTLALGK